MLAGMRYRISSYLPSIALVIALLAVLVVLAVFQYRWIGQVSDAERDRLRFGLGNAVDEFRAEFNRELARICAAAQVTPAMQEAEGDWNRYAQVCHERIAQLAFADLVREILVWREAHDGSSRFLKLDRDAPRFVDAPFPGYLDKLRALSVQPAAPGRRYPRDARAETWLFFGSIPALVHRLPPVRSEEAPRPERDTARTVLIVELDPGFVTREFLPELAQRYFSGPEGFHYDAMIRGTTGSVLFISDMSLSEADFRNADARTPLLPQVRDLMARMAAGGRPAGLVPREPPPPPLAAGGFRGDPQQRFSRFFPPVILLSAGEDDNWQLAARPLQGSLNSVVEGMRRRNLAISFGILILLAASLVMVVVSTQRARRLAHMQMNFVAGVSHELRTPLAVICSAGDNLAAGILPEGGGQVRKYGELVRDEGRRLAKMVEQILHFAGTQAGRQRVALRPVQVVELVQRQLKQMQGLIESSGFVLEMSLEPEMPSILADPEGLSRCIENLVTNALRYGVKSKWLGIRVHKAEKGQPEIQIAVADRGMGIDAQDLPRIFDPFYRGRAATLTQAHGSGLGLSITRETIASMGGRISVSSIPGQGSVFTIHLPAHFYSNQSTGEREHPLSR